MTDFPALLQALAGAEAEFILIGGVAATVHGSARLTQDLDVLYRRTPENHQRLVSALSSLQPYLRGAPAGLPFVFDARTLDQGLNFTLTTSMGALDLLGEIPGGRYEDFLPRIVSLRLFGCTVACLDLDALIHAKRAAGRPKDLEAIAELEALRRERTDPS